MRIVVISMKIDNKGFTLIEIVVSLALISLVLVFMFGMFLQGTTGIIQAANKNESTYNAMDKMENVIAGSSTTSEDLSLTIQLPVGSITQDGKKITKISNDYNGKTSEVITFLPDSEIAAETPLSFVTTSPLPDAKKKQAYSTTVVAAGGSGGNTFSATGLTGSLAWLSLNPTTGGLSGTAPNSAGGPYTFTVTVEDSEGNTKSASFSLTIKN